MANFKRRVFILWIFLLLALCFLYYMNELRIDKYPTQTQTRGILYSNHTLDDNITQNSHLKLENMDTVAIELISSRHAMRVYINEKIVYVSPLGEAGISMVVINPVSLEILKTGHFNTYGSESESDSLLSAIQNCQKNDLIILGVADEGSYKLQGSLKLELSKLGSSHIKNLKFRSVWGMIFLKDQALLSEEISHKKYAEDWPRPIHIYASLSTQDNVVSFQTSLCLKWPQTNSFIRRRSFCMKYVKEFPKICNCEKYSPIDFRYKPLKKQKNQLTSGNNDINKVLSKTPIAIVTSSRPAYLMRCLQRLLSVEGARKNMIKIYTDSKNPINVDIAKLFGIDLYYTPKRCSAPCAIAMHYRSMFTDVAKNNPDAPEFIIIEEDLLVSTDFFYYFAQVMPFYRTNNHYYCVSAWNDQSYNHTLGDNQMIYLTHTMPGLGFAIKRSTVVNDWLPSWPKIPQQFDWDYFVRSDRIRNGRECIVPDISRTFHYGEKGYSINVFSQKAHFNTRPAVTLKETNFDLSWLKNNSYESVMVDLIKNARPVKSTTLSQVCTIGKQAYDNYYNSKMMNKNYEFLPKNGVSMEELKKNTQVIYLKMGKGFDQTQWRKVSTCWMIWTMDERDFHFGALRIWFSGVHYIVVMCPLSKYCEYKPADISPILII